MSGDYLAAATAAGLIGFDPVGAFVAVAAVSLGASRRGLVALVAAYLAAVAGLGTAITLAVRAGLHADSLRGFLPSVRTLTLAEIAGGGLLVAAGAVMALRARQGTRHEDDAASRKPSTSQRRLSASVPGLAAAGVGVAVSLVVDPGFLMLVAVCAPHPAWTYALVFTYWGVWSQILMVAFCAAALLDRNGRLVGPLRRTVEVIRARSHAVAAVVLAVFGLALVLDGAHRLGALLVGGRWAG